MANLASDWLRHFDFSSETAERNTTELDWKQYLNVLYQSCVFGTARNPRWPSRPPICRDIFDFSSETAEPNSRKLDRKGDLNVLYQGDVFRPVGVLNSSSLEHYIQNCDIGVAYKSDYSSVSINFEFLEQIRGKDTWKFNCSLLYNFRICANNQKLNARNHTTI